MGFKIPRQTLKIFLCQIKLYYSEYIKQNSIILGNETQNNRFAFFNIIIQVIGAYQMHTHLQSHT